MTKKPLFYIIIILILIILGGVIYYFYTRENPVVNENQNVNQSKLVCGGLVSQKCPEGYFCKYNANINSTDQMGECLSKDEPVEYDKSFGTICPLGIKFLGKARANTIDCKCPEGYEFDSSIFGYEQCYGEGTECPIMSSECVPAGLTNTNS